MPRVRVSVFIRHRSERMCFCRYLYSSFSLTSTPHLTSPPPPALQVAAGAGATATVVVIKDDKLVVANVGDSQVGGVAGGGGTARCGVRGGGDGVAGRGGLCARAQ